MLIKEDYAALSILLFPFILILLLSPLAGEGREQNNKVEIDVYNPYRISATLRVKCDWDNTNEEFTFDKEIKVPGNSNTKLIVPNRMKKCQVWPKINILP